MKYTPIILISALIFLLLPTSITIYRWATTPSDRVFAGTSGFSDDYNVYASAITEGVRGRWTVSNKFTSELHQGAFIHEEYLLLGKFLGPPTQFLFQILNVPYYIPSTPVVFHLSRLVLAILLLWSLWEFIKAIIPDTNSPVRLTSWLLVLFSGTLPQAIMEKVPSQFSWIATTPYFREMNVIYRFNLLHQTQTGIIALLLLLTIYLKSLRHNRFTYRTYILSFFFAILASWTDVICALTVFLIISGFLFFRLVINQNLKKIIPSILYLATIGVAILPSVLYFYHLRTQAVWVGIARYIPDQNPFSLGAFFFLFPLIIPWVLFFVVHHLRSVLKSQNIIPSDSFLLLISWLLTFVILVLFSDIIQVNRLRLLRPPVLVPLSILASFGMYSFSRFLSKKWTLPILGALVVLTFYPSIFTTYSALKEEYQLLSSFSTIVYPTKNQTMAYAWLFHNTPENTVVAALYEGASLLPPFSGNATYAGNVTEDPGDYNEKSTKLATFFSGSMSKKEAKNFLISSRISYIYWGYQERSLGENLQQYPFLHQVYINPDVTIFQVRQSDQDLYPRPPG